MKARSSCFWMLGVAAVAVTFGCEGEQVALLPAPVLSEPEVEVALETDILDAQHIEAAVNEATAIVGLREASGSAADLAGIGLFPPSALGETGIYQITAGEETVLSYDIDNDEVLESLLVFIPAGRTAYVAWSEDGRCRLAWKHDQTPWYIDVVCGEDGGLVCNYEGGAECTLCDSDYCAPCTVEGRRVTCEEIVPPEPDVGLDASSDVDVPDVSDDALPPSDTSSDTSFDTPRRGRTTPPCPRTPPRSWGHAPRPAWTPLGRSAVPAAAARRRTASRSARAPGTPGTARCNVASATTCSSVTNSVRFRRPIASGADRHSRRSS